jgi:hypothetical protein
MGRQPAQSAAFSCWSFGDRGRQALRLGALASLSPPDSLHLHPIRPKPGRSPAWLSLHASRSASADEAEHKRHRLLSRMQHAECVAAV